MEQLYYMLAYDALVHNEMCTKEGYDKSLWKVGLLAAVKPAMMTEPHPLWNSQEMMRMNRTFFCDSLTQQAVEYYAVYRAHYANLKVPVNVIISEKSYYKPLAERLSLALAIVNLALKDSVERDVKELQKEIDSYCTPEPVTSTQKVETITKLIRGLTRSSLRDLCKETKIPDPYPPSLPQDLSFLDGSESEDESKSEE